MTYLSVKELKEKRRNVWDGMEALLAEARKEDRGLDDAGRTEFDAREAEFVKLTADIERLEKHEARGKARDGVAETRGVSRDEMDTAEKRYERAYVSWFKRGLAGLDSEARTTLDSGHGLSTAPNSSGIAAGSQGYNGGYLVPQGFWANLQIALKEYGGILQYCNILQTDSGQPMPWPTV